MAEPKLPYGELKLCSRIDLPLTTLMAEPKLPYGELKLAIPAHPTGSLLHG